MITVECKELAVQFQFVHQTVLVFCIFNDGHIVSSEFCLIMSGVEAKFPFESMQICLERN